MNDAFQLPEIDTPGHVFSWGNAFPSIILECSKLISGGKDYAGINNVPLDMTNDLTYQVVSDVITEIAQIFTDEYIHLGYETFRSKMSLIADRMYIVVVTRFLRAA